MRIFSGDWETAVNIPKPSLAIAFIVVVAASTALGNGPAYAGFGTQGTHFIRLA